MKRDILVRFYPAWTLVALIFLNASIQETECISSCGLRIGRCDRKKNVQMIENEEREETKSNIEFRTTAELPELDQTPHELPEIVQTPSKQPTEGEIKDLDVESKSELDFEFDDDEQSSTDEIEKLQKELTDCEEHFSVVLTRVSVRTLTKEITPEEKKEAQRDILLTLNKCTQIENTLKDHQKTKEIKNLDKDEIMETDKEIEGKQEREEEIEKLKIDLKDCEEEANLLYSTTAVRVLTESITREERAKAENDYNLIKLRCHLTERLIEQYEDGKR